MKIKQYNIVSLCLQPHNTRVNINTEQILIEWTIFSFCSILKTDLDKSCIYLSKNYVENKVIDCRNIPSRCISDTRFQLLLLLLLLTLFPSTHLSFKRLLAQGTQTTTLLSSSRRSRPSTSLTHLSERTAVDSCRHNLLFQP